MARKFAFVCSYITEFIAYIVPEHAFLVYHGFQRRHFYIEKSEGFVGNQSSD